MSDIQHSKSDDEILKGPIEWAARNSIFANLLMVLLIIGGLWTAATMQKEVLPESQLDIVSVSVVYPGAAPSEVEQGIVLPVEEAIRGVDGIKEISSRSREGSGSVSIELVAGANRMKAFQDIDQAVSRIRTFPDDIEEPEVVLQSRQREVMSVGLYGEVDVWTLRKLGERLRDVFLANPNITEVDLGNVPDYVTHVEIPRDVLREYGLTLNDVAGVIQQSSNDISAGAVETTGGEILLRVNERKQWAREFETIEIISSATGGTVRLADIATVYDGFEDDGFHSQFNRTPSIEVEVYRVGDQSPLDVEDAVLGIMADFERQLPPGVEWRIDGNSAEDFRGRMNLLIENGLLAIVIVMAILTLFLELHLAFWVMMGMTISFVGGIIFLPMMGQSINMISMFGFLVVLGIVVDDAIIVGENIYEYRQREGTSNLSAAISGARRMAGPVTFSILTNIVAFIPLFFIPGSTGKFWTPLPAVVIVVLALSLFEALFILPAHLAHTKRKGKGTTIGNAFHNFQQGFATRFNHFVQTYFARFLDYSLKNRYITITVMICLFLGVGSYANSSHMGMIFMPTVSADEIEAGIRMPVGTTPDQAGEIAETVTDSTLRMFEEFNLWAVADGVKTNVRGDNFIDVEIVMKDPDERDMTAAEVIELWRDNIGDLPGVDQVTFEAERGPGGWRQDISVDLSHSNVDILEKAAAEFERVAKQYPNTRDVNDNYNKGKQQIDFTITEEGRALGLTAAEIGRQLRGAFFGDLALRLLRGTNEIEVRVKLPEEQRKDIHNLEDYVVRTPSGTEVPLADVVQFRNTEAFTSINRRNGRRIVTVSMDVEPKREVTQVIDSLNNEVLPQLATDFPGVTWTFEGSQAEMRDSTAALWGGMGLAMCVIYSLLALAFRDYWQPFIVLSAIPFGMIGAVIGHIILGYDLSVISLMGVIALSGVVVNDSLIMVDHANDKRQHMPVLDAIREAGTRRFRPIILTTLTTFGGLSPIIMEKSLQAQYLIPMAISLGFGIVFATAIILLLVPCFYMALEDIKGLLTEEVEV